MPEIRGARGHKLHELTKTMWHHHNAGTAAEALKIMQLRAWKAVRALFPVEEAAIALQMHDELIWQVRDDLVEQVADLNKTAFSREINGLLPFRLTVKIGQNWLETSK